MEVIVDELLKNNVDIDMTILSQHINYDVAWHEKLYGEMAERLAEKFFGITLRLGYQAQNYAFASDINCVVYVRL